MTRVKENRRAVGNTKPFIYFGLQLTGAFFGWTLAMGVLDILGAHSSIKYVVWAAVGVFVIKAYKRTEAVIKRQDVYKKEECSCV
jgi:hypothetical protein